jgi:two-component system, response regulator, stage 0 sporulation protein F
MICEEFRETLEHEGHQVDFALDGKEGIRKIQDRDYNLVFLDSSMPSMEGKKVLERIRHFSQVPVALITGFITESKEKEVLQLGATACLRKPLDLDRIKSLIHTVARTPPH